MTSLAAILALGFLLGMRHATDADHVVAISTIVTRQRSVGKAGLIGVLWGLGHTFTIFVVGAAIILFQVTIPPRLGLSMELAVAAMLIFLGILNLTGTLARLQERFMPARPVFAFSQGALSQGALSQEAAPEASGALRDLGMYGVLRPIAIGLVHGLAGSAAVALLVLATIRNPWWAMIYLVVFGFGTVAGMMFITVLIAMPLVWTGRRFSELNRKMAFASGLVSLCFGAFLTYQIAIVDGLFRAHPLWTAH